jgi:flagellar biosynthesis/type III secretory pathway ATPase
VGLNRLRSQVKRSRVVRQALYRPYRDDRPTIDPVLAVELRQQFAGEVRSLDVMLGTAMGQRWGYEAPMEAAPQG